MEEFGEIVGENLLPTKIHGFTKDLVDKLTARINSPVKLETKVVELEHHDDGNGRFEEEEEEGEIELNLGLSLNGKFGIDPKRSPLKLFRASTMSTTVTLKYEPQEVQSAVHAPPPLIGTCSLPSLRIVEESRKRRELQSLKRLEAKKRRIEKQRLSEEGRKKVDNNNNLCIKNNGDHGFVCNNGDGAFPALLQGSELVSQGSGSSSGISELESNSIQDSSLTNDAKSELDRKFTGKTNRFTNDAKSELDRKLPGKTNSTRSRQCRTSDHKPPVAPPPRRVSGMDKQQQPRNVAVAEELEKKKMPFVSTVGKGQNGKRIEGFLYEYRKGEEVKIVCICHGISFSPAEFVKHAGGDEVENPFRHIVVSPPPPPPPPCL